MAFIVYTVVLVVSVLSVAVGFEMLASPVERMEKTQIRSEIQHRAAAKPPAHVRDATTTSKRRTPRNERYALTPIYPAAPDASAGRAKAATEDAASRAPGAARRASAETPTRS
jgi:hypothetical protein